MHSIIILIPIDTAQNTVRHKAETMEVKMVKSQLHMKDFSAEMWKQ